MNAVQPDLQPRSAFETAERLSVNYGPVGPSAFCNDGLSVEHYVIFNSGGKCLARLADFRAKIIV
jgi:hypothetical protein